MKTTHQTQTDILELLHNGSIVNIKLTGVNAGNRQNLIKHMITQNSKTVYLYPETDNQYDKYAIRVDAEYGDIGFIPKNKDFYIKLPRRRRGITIQNVYDHSGNMLNTNQVFHQFLQENKIKAQVVKFNNYGNTNIPVGIVIEFWLDTK